MILNEKVINYKAEEIINIYKFCIGHFSIQHCLNGSQKWMRHFMEPGLQLLCFIEPCIYNYCRWTMKKEPCIYNYCRWTMKKDHPI